MTNAVIRYQTKPEATQRNVDLIKDVANVLGIPVDEGRPAADTLVDAVGTLKAASGEIRAFCR